MKRTIRIEFQVNEVERAAYDSVRGMIPLAAWIRYTLNTAVAQKNQARRPAKPREVRSGNGA